MRKDISEAIESGILKPAKDLVLDDSENETFKKGFIFGKSHEILTKGHPVMSVSGWMDKVKSRLEVGGYLFSPGKFKFEKTVWILCVIFRFIKSFKCLSGKLTKSDHKFTMLLVTPKVSNTDSDYSAVNS